MRTQRTLDFELWDSDSFYVVLLNSVMALLMRSLCISITFWFVSNIRMEVIRLAIASVGDVLDASTKPCRTPVAVAAFGCACALSARKNPPFAIVITSGRLVCTGKFFTSGNESGAALVVKAVMDAKSKRVARKNFMKANG